MNLKERATKIKSDIPVLYLSLKDKSTPILAKIMAWLTVAYALSPIDLIPDFIPVLGCLDDLILIPVMIAITIKLIPKEVWEYNKVKAEGLWQDEKPLKWYYALPVVLVWLLIIWLIVKPFIRPFS